MSFSGRIEAFIQVPGGTNLQVTTGTTTIVALSSGSYTPTQLAAHIQASLIAQNAVGWLVSISVGASGTGRVRITGPGTWSITWQAGNLLRDLLGFTANIVSATGFRDATISVRGLWLPWCPLAIEGDQERAPTVSDLRTTRSPNGNVFALSGNRFYRHRAVTWSHVPKARMFEAVALHAGNTWETFFKQTQIGGYVPWLGPASAIEVYDHNDLRVGADIIGIKWKIVGIDSIEPKRSSGDWNGLWTVTLPELVAA